MYPFLKGVLKKHLSLRTIFIVLMALITIETSLDLWLLDYSTDLFVMQEEHYTRFIVEYAYYFIMIFLIATFTLSKLAQKTFTQTANFMIRLYSVILLPVTLDVLIFNSRTGYDYATPENFFMNLLTVTFNSPDVTMGISITGVVTFVSVFFYLLYNKKSLPYAFFGAVLFPAVVILLSTPDMLFGAGNASYYYDYFLPLYYFMPGLMIMLFLLSHYSPQGTKDLLSKFSFKNGFLAMAVLILTVLLLNQEANVYYILTAALTSFLFVQLAHTAKYATKTPEKTQIDYSLVFLVLSVLILTNSLFIGLAALLLSGLAVCFVFFLRSGRFLRDITTAPALIFPLTLGLLI